MSSKRYPEEFKIEAVKQVTDRGHPAAEVASRLGVSLPTLYEWLKRYSVLEAERSELQGQEKTAARIDRHSRLCLMFQGFAWWACTD
jgi:transposase